MCSAIARNAQEAHKAICPTDCARTPDTVTGTSVVVLIGGLLGTVAVCALIAIVDEIRVTLHEIRDIANQRMHYGAS